MKPHPSPRCVSSLSQQTSRAPLKVVTDQDGARASYSKLPLTQTGQGISVERETSAGSAAPVVESPREFPLKPVGNSFAAVLGKLVVE